MTSTTSPSNKLITSSSNEQTSIVENDLVEDNSQKKKSTNTAASAQMQLLGLAKQFIVDGAFISAEKQMPLEDRSKKRERINELRKQQNLEVIMQKTMQYCSNSQISDRADQDWFNCFIDLAEGISNKTMQELWAKILAGEISSPGSFSLKSLQAFRTMSITEAKLLAKACSLAVRDNTKNVRIISGAYQIPSLFNFFSKHREHKINLNQFGLSYAELLTLADNHLLFIQETESTPYNKGEKLHFSANGQSLNFIAQKKDTVLNFYKFTPIGTELAQLISDNSAPQYLQAMKTQLKAFFSITEKN
jgi:uncharacterized repeat protein (TIGR03899 family)